VSLCLWWQRRLRRSHGITHSSVKLGLFLLHFNVSSLCRMRCLDRPPLEVLSASQRNFFPTDEITARLWVLKEYLMLSGCPKGRSTSLPSCTSNIMTALVLLSVKIKLKLVLVRSVMSIYWMSHLVRRMRSATTCQLLSGALQAWTDILERRERPRYPCFRGLYSVEHLGREEIYSLINFDVCFCLLVVLSPLLLQSAFHTFTCVVNWGRNGDLVTREHALLRNNLSASLADVNVLKLRRRR
jgi:hypothetical protein